MVTPECSTDHPSAPITRSPRHSRPSQSAYTRTRQLAYTLFASACLLIVATLKVQIKLTHLDETCLL